MEQRAGGQQWHLYRGCNCNDPSFLNTNFEVFQGIILLSVKNTDNTDDKLFLFQ